MDRKKFLRLVLPAGLVVVALLMVFFYLRGPKLQGVSALHVVPPDAGLIVEVKNLGRLIKEMKSEPRGWKEWMELPAFKEIEENLVFLDSMASNHPELGHALDDEGFLFSAHRVGRQVMFLGYIAVHRAGDHKQIDQLVKELAGPSALFSRRDYEGVRLHEVSFPAPSKGKPFFYAFSRGILIIGRSSILVEDAIRQSIQDVSIANNKSFLQLRRTAGKNSPLNLYLQQAHFARLLETTSQPGSRELFAKLGGFAEWTGLDLLIREDAWQFSGFSVLPDSLPYFLHAIRRQQPVRISSPGVIPAHAAFFVTLALSDFPRYLDDYNRYLQSYGDARGRVSYFTGISNSYKVDVLQVMQDVLDGEFSLVYAPSGDSPDESTRVVCQVKSQSAAETEFLKLVKNPFGEVYPGAAIHAVKIDNELDIKVYQLPVAGLPGKLFGSFFGKSDFRFLTFYSNCIIFGNSLESLKTYVHSLVLNATLSREIEFNKLARFQTGQSSVYVFAKPFASVDFMEQYLDKKLIKSIRDNLGLIGNARAMIWQMNTSGGMVYHNLFGAFGESRAEQPGTAWSSLLDTAIFYKPQFLANHLTGETEILVQDVLNQVYLINQMGRVLWKLQLPGRIESDVTQIDYFKNRKLQMVFSTRDHIYILDRNGNHVERSPFKLRSPATNGVAVFDYENTRDYRFFVACADRKVYCYDKQGVLVKGWEFPGTEQEVTMPLMHLRVENKDFIAFADTYKCYLLDRRGQHRARINEMIPFSGNNRLVFENTGRLATSRLATTDTSGVVHFIYLTGKTEKAILGNFSNRHFFDYQDLTGNGEREFIFADQRRLEVFTRKKSLSFRVNLDHDVEERPVFYHFSGKDRKIGMVAPGINQIYLYNNDGNLYRGFPLKGSTLFSIGSLQKGSARFNLVVGSRNNFLYNYTVQ